MNKNLLLLVESDYTCLHAVEYGYIDFTNHLFTGSTTISIIQSLVKFWILYKPEGMCGDVRFGALCAANCN